MDRQRRSAEGAKSKGPLKRAAATTDTPQPARPRIKSGAGSERSAAGAKSKGRPIDRETASTF
jgi:hypothetical protein